ncbi:MAG: flagellar protein FlaG [Clostridiales bacterium]|nr:flagellar protein FlaG [Clostridiales bacterium]
MMIETVGSSAVSSYATGDTVRPVEKPASTNSAAQIANQGETNITITERPVQNVSAGDGENSKENSQGQANERQIKDAVNNANNKLKMNHKTGCEFSYHEETGRVSIKVIDQETKEVIREIPPEESLEMLQKLWELAGVLVDERR